MNHFAIWLILISVFTAQVKAEELTSIPTDIQKQLLSGKVATLPARPGEPTNNIDQRFVTMAKLIAGSRSEIWAVINDKENAEQFLDGVLESHIVKKEGNEVIVSQRTKVGGPKGSYNYTLKYVLTPEKLASFTFIEGDIKNVVGAWWIFDGPDPKRKLVVYSLHIDPGRFAPQVIVKKGIKKTIPSTILSTEQEVLRRQKMAIPKQLAGKNGA